MADICKIGDPMKVRVIAVDEQERVKLSRRAALVEEGADSDEQMAGVGADSGNANGSRGEGQGNGPRRGGGGGRKRESRS